MNDKIENNCGIIKILDLPKDICHDFERQRKVCSIFGICPTLLARTDSAKILVKVKRGTYGKYK